MAKAKSKTTGKRGRVPTHKELRQTVLDDVRKIRKLEQTITSEGRALERAHAAAQKRLRKLLDEFVDVEDLVLVDRESWDRIRDEHTAMKQRLEVLDKPNADSVREMARA